MPKMQELLSEWFEPSDGSVRVNEIADMMRYRRAWKEVDDPQPLASALREFGCTIRRDRWGVRRAEGIRWREMPRERGQGELI